MHSGLSFVLCETNIFVIQLIAASDNHIENFNIQLYTIIVLIEYIVLYRVEKMNAVIKL